MMEKTHSHKPVLVSEILEAFNLDTDAHLQSQITIIDATVGAGGHSVEFVKRGAFVLGIDDDFEMLDIARSKLTEACPVPISDRDPLPFKLHHGNFRNIASIAEREHIVPDYILIDLGINTIQLLDRQRGFSFRSEDAVLDMRINTKDQSVKACDLLNALPEKSLIELFSVCLDWKSAVRLAKEIVGSRAEKPIVTVGDFLTLIEKVPYKKGFKTDKATLPFMALRIAVNSELENLDSVLTSAFSILKKGGKLAIMTFHSGEDRMVKSHFKTLEERGEGINFSKKPILPKEIEINRNNSARSAKLRIIQKLK